MDTAITTPSPLRVLLVKTSSMGDLVHALSAVQEAHHHRPLLSVDWVAEESFADIARLSPAVARVIPVAMRRWRQRPLAKSTRGEIKAFVHELRSQSYDAVIDAQGLMKSAWITALARCPSRAKWGFDRASIREPLATLVLNERVHAPNDLHAIQRLQMLFGAALGYAPASEPPVLASPVWQRSSRPLAFASAMDQQRFVILLHGTSRHAKAWPADQWAALALMLIGQGLRVVLPWGSAQEMQTAHDIARAAGDHAWVAPKMAIGEMAAMMMASEAVVGVDSGLMHLSAALGRPTVAVMCAGLSPRFAASRFAPPWKAHVRVVVPASPNAAIVAPTVQESLMSLMPRMSSTQPSQS